MVETRGVPAAACIVWAILVAAPVSAGPAESKLLTLLQEAGARPTACPEDVSEVASAEALCGTTDRRAKRARESLREFLDGHHPRNRDRPWTREASWKYRRALVDAQPYRVAFDVGRDLVAVSPEPACFGDDFPEDEVLRADTEGLRHPALTQKVRPEFPERARRNRTGGTFDGWVWIDRDGRVVDICTIHVLPERMGFEESAFAAVRQWRYEAATLDDEPVPVLWYVWLEWSIGAPR